MRRFKPASLGYAGYAVIALILSLALLAPAASLDVAVSAAVFPAAAAPLAGLQKAQDADWPSYRHDAARSGRTAHALDWQQLRPQWQQSLGRPMPAWPGPAQWDAYAALPGLKSMRDYDSAFHLIAIGHCIYLGSNRDSTVECRSAESGELIWRHQAAGPVRITPTFVATSNGAKSNAQQTGGAAGKLYFGDDSGTVTCLNAENGDVVWTFAPHAEERQVIHEGRYISFAPVRTGVVVRDGWAYFGASFLPWKPSYLYAVNANTGKTSGNGFSRDLGAGWTLEGPMLASERNLVMPQGRVSPLVFARKDGAPEGTLEGGGGSFCLLTDDEQILHGPGNKTGWITASNSDGRAKIASYDKGNSIVVDGSTAFLLSDRGLSAFDRQSQALLWSRPVDTPYTLIQAGSHLVAGGEGVVRVFEAESGNEVWAADVPGKALGLVAAQQRLLVSTDSGHIVGFGVAGEQLAQWQPSAPLQWQVKDSVGTAPAVAKINDRKLLDHWLFQSNVQLQVEILPDDPRTTTVYANLGARAMAAQPIGASQLQKQGSWHSAVLDGRQGDFEVATLSGHELLPTRPTKQSLDSGVKIAKAVRNAKLPKRKFSAEAWVRIDQPTEWGGIVSASQDNGSYERGWLLGYRKNHFSFALKSEKGSEQLSWLRAPQPFQMGAWHHVVGTYDGKTMLLYVDGKQVAEGNNASGDVHYPEDGWYHVGAYRDKDEHFRLQGALHEVKLHDRVLKPADVTAAFEAKADLIPAPLVIAPPREKPQVDLTLHVQPWIRLYQGDHSAGSTPEDQLGYADVTWASREQMATEIEFLAAQDVPGPDGKFPAAPVGGWKPSPPLSYEVTQAADVVASGQTHSVRIHGLPPRTVQHFRVVQRSGDQVRRSRIYELDSHFAQLKPTVETGLRSPIVLSLGQPVTKESLQQYSLLVEPNQVRSIEINQLPLLPPMSADAIFITGVEQLPAKTVEQIARVLVPGGAWLDSSKRDLPAHFKRQDVGESSQYSCYTSAQMPEGSSSWTHLYGRADNTAYGGESLSGATSVSEMEVQWVAPPGPRYQADRQSRRPSPLAMDGKLFLQGKDRILGLNSFNGQTLWGWELPELDRFNMPRDCSNWCLGEAQNRLYVAIGGHCWALNPDSGEREQSYSATALHNEGLAAEKQEEMSWGYVASVNGVLLGSAVRPGNTFKDWWGGTFWYDAREGSATEKVCSDSLFALPSGGDYQKWTYRGGLILNTTITVADDTVYFLENRSTEVISGQARRFSGSGLFDDLHMVALNLKDGSLKWQRQAKPLPGDVAVWLSAAEGRLIMVTSHKNPKVGEQGGEFAVYSFDAKDASSQWRRKFTWEVDHHGKALSRPTIVGGHLYLRPVVLAMKDGELLRQAFPSGHQCGTYVAADNAVILRCGNLSTWSREDWTASGWERLRPDCWISTIPANGMLLSPEGGGGCSCGSWMETSLGFMPLAADPNYN